jgi:hypothetical protein
MTELCNAQTFLSAKKSAPFFAYSYVEIEKQENHQMDLEIPVSAKTEKK